MLNKIYFCIKNYHELRLIKGVYNEIFFNEIIYERSIWDRSQNFFDLYRSDPIWSDLKKILEIDSPSKLKPKQFLNNLKWLIIPTNIRR